MARKPRACRARRPDPGRPRGDPRRARARGARAPTAASACTEAVAALPSSLPPSPSRWRSSAASRCPSAPPRGSLGALLRPATRSSSTSARAARGPVQLVLVPMLLLLPPALVPAAHRRGARPRALPGIAARRERRTRLLPALADAWFSVAPALVLAIFGLPDGLLGGGGRARPGALPARSASTSSSPRCGCGSASGWASATSSAASPGSTSSTCCSPRWPCSPPSPVATTPLVVAAVLPLAALLAVFARERRGRIENALRAAPPGRRRASSGCSRSSRTPPT